MREHRGRSERRGKVEVSGEETTVSGVSVRAVQKRIDQMAGKFWKPPAGEHEIRVLPPQACQNGDFVLGQCIHYGIEVAGKARTVACLRALDEECPICDLVDELRNNGNEDDAKVGDDLRATDQFLCEVLIRPSKRIRIYSMSSGVYRKLADALASPRIGDFTDARKGRDLLLTRKGEGMRTRYDVQCLDRSPLLPEEDIKHLLKHRYDLTRLTSPVLSAKKLHRILEKQYGIGKA